MIRQKELQNRTVFSRACRHISCVGAAFAILLLFSSVSYAGDTLLNPTSADLYFLQLKLSHRLPVYDDLAELDNSVHSVDEFHRGAATQKAEAILRAKNAAIAGVTKLVVNLSTRFGEYDDQNKEYDFDISDGTFIDVGRAFGHEIRIALTNGNSAQIWKLDPTAAAAILKKTKGERSVTLMLRLDILNGPPAADNEPMVINTKIAGYDIVAPISNAKLGKVVVAE